MKAPLTVSLVLMALAMALIDQRLEQVKQRVKDNDVLITALTLSNQQLEDQITVLQKRVKVMNGSLLVVPTEGK